MASYRRTAVEQAATTTQHNQIIGCGEHFHARLMHHGNNSETACCKLFKQLEKRQSAAAIEAAGGFVQEQAQRTSGQSNTEANAATLTAANAAIIQGE